MKALPPIAVPALCPNGPGAVAGELDCEGVIPRSCLVGWTTPKTSAGGICSDLDAAGCRGKEGTGSNEAVGEAQDPLKSPDIVVVWVPRAFWKAGKLGTADSIPLNTLFAL